MAKVLLFSGLLLAGLVLGQFIGTLFGSSEPAVRMAVQLCTMTALAFIMIHVGLEFDIEKRNLKAYGWDGTVAASAAILPWLFCLAYFVFAILPQAAWSNGDVWREGLLASLFAAPTSAGVLFSMLAAAGLASTWVFKKARVLAIFDDLVTVLLMIPLKMAIVGMKWQLAVVVVVMATFLAFAYIFLHRFRLPSKWYHVLGYSVAMVAIIEVVHIFSKQIDADVPIHIEVLLPAFALGCMMRTKHHDHANADHADHGDAPGNRAEDNHGTLDAQASHDATEARASTIISGFFMLLVGLSMPSLAAASSLAASAAPASTEKLAGHAMRELTPAMGWGTILFHVGVVTVISNLGKMLPALCYRKEATLRERLAVAVGMWPRGEVGAGVLVVSLGYGISGPIVVIAMLALALNLVLTGFFIVIVKRLLGLNAAPSGRN